MIGSSAAWQNTCRFSLLVSGSKLLQLSSQQTFGSSLSISRCLGEIGFADLGFFWSRRPNGFGQTRQTWRVVVLVLQEINSQLSVDFTESSRSGILKERHCLYRLICCNFRFIGLFISCKCAGTFEFRFEYPSHLQCSETWLRMWFIDVLVSPWLLRNVYNSSQFPRGDFSLRS